MNPRTAAFQSSGSAFSVLELLVSVTVLSILVLILSQIVVLTGQAIGANTKKLDGAAQARLFFSRLESDLALRPRRADLGMTVVKAAGNDSLRFYCGVGGYSGSRSVSLVGYRIQENASGRHFQLERGVTGSDWTPSPAGRQPLFLSQSLSAPPDTDYEVLARGLFRMEISYLLNTPSLSNRRAVAAAADYGDVEALIVTIAVIDAKSRALLGDAQIRALSRSLPDAVSGEEPLPAWNALLLQPGFAEGIPRLALQGVHLYQRAFHVP